MVSSTVSIMTSITAATTPDRALPDGLTDEQADVLDFERHWWKYNGAKETAIRGRWDISSTVYYMRLNAIIELPAALAYDPLLVRRLQRLRRARQVQRSAERLGFEA